MLIRVLAALAFSLLFALPASAAAPPAAALPPTGSARIGPLQLLLPLPPLP